MSWRTYTLGELIDNFSVKAKDYDIETSSLDFCGVSNEKGITLSKYAAEDKADDYKIIEQNCFAYNPYRINVGSIGLLEDDTVGLISPAYVVFKPKPQSIIPQLLLKFLKSAEGLRQIKLHARGTVRQALRYADLCKIELSLPDYEDQIDFYKRIINTEKESNILTSEITHQLDLVKQLRQAFLREAMQGKLVAQDPNDESASVLLEKIKAEKEQLIKEKKIKKQKPLPPITQEEIPFEIPENWVWCRLGEVVEDLKYGTSQSCSYENKKNSPVLRIPNVSSGKLDIEDLKYTNLSDKDISELALKKGDILTIRSNGSRELVGKTAIVHSEVEGFAYAGYLIRLRFNNNYVNSIFIWKATNSPYFRDLIEKPLRTTVGINNINSTELSLLKIPLPPLPEQQCIAAKLDELMNYCDQLEESIKNSQQQNEMLLQQVLREALEPKEKDTGNY